MGGEAYVFRGVGGRWASSEMDKLAGKIKQSGVEAEVYDYGAWRHAADTAIERYNSEGRKSAIIAMGHSAGGDAAIRFARRLEDAGVPVSLIVTFDPTRGARRVPSNVDRFINIYESTNVIGGGDPSPSPGFHGQFASIDFKNWDVLHVNVPKIGSVQAEVVAKVVQTVSLPVALDASAVPIEYVIPRNEPIELWDSGLPITAEEGDTAASIAARYEIPVWAVAQINRVAPLTPLAGGRRLVVPYHLEAELGGVAPEKTTKID